MTSSEIRQRFLDFFAKRGHAILPSASLVPKNDPSVLFNTAGMQPLVPYLMGEPHPHGTRLASCQKCVRTGDIEAVGNNKNLTFFEMLGNWSLGDYFKEDAIRWSFEFLTSKEEGLDLDPSRLYVTVFEGDDNAPRDMEALEIWKQYIPENRIYFLPAENNWWSPGDNGPCGPDTEMFYDVTEKGLGDITHEEYVAADTRGDVVEIWNNVFMEYVKEDGKVIGKLAQKNVDTGSGLERITMIVQGKTNVYETDLFLSLLQIINDFSKNIDEREQRLIVDHIKASMFMISDGVIPGKEKSSYVLRKLIRRAVRVSDFKNTTTDKVFEIIIDEVIRIYKESYPELYESKEYIKNILLRETREVMSLDGRSIGIIDTYLKNLNITPPTIQELIPGQKIKGSYSVVIAKVMFDLITTKGIHRDILINYLKNKHYFVLPHELKDLESLLQNHIEEHKNLSRQSSQGMFKGGLANTSEMTTKLHTAHHLLLAALQKVVSPDIHQKGSNITEERLRIDFSLDRKLTDNEKKAVEDLVNEWITADYAVVRREMPREEAEKIGAEMEFGTKYPDIVSLYVIEDKDGTPISKEFCGGPHVAHTGVLGHFTIQKEEASSNGIRRIKALLT